MSRTDVTVEEAVKSLNGFDEIAIEQKYGLELEALQEKPLKLMRALAFIIFRREGQDDAEALESSQTLTLGSLEEFFATDEDEVDPEEPTTEAGKGDGSPN